MSKKVQTFAYAVRSHWGIENKVHWVLDIAERSDDSRVRVGESSHNLAILRHISLNRSREKKKRQKWVSKPSGLKLVGAMSIFSRVLGFQNEVLEVQN